MVEMLEDKSSFDEDRVTMNTFLSSVKSWHKKTGVHCGVEKIYTKEDKALGIKNAIIRESSFDWAKFNQVFLKFYLEKIEAGWHNQL